MALTEKEMIQELKTEWKKLWQERFDDRLRAEGIAVTDYSSLFERFVQPNPQVGGWNKFIKTEITNQKPQRNKRAASYCPEKKEVQQPKKGGRGWLHR